MAFVIGALSSNPAELKKSGALRYLKERRCQQMRSLIPNSDNATFPGP
jgi:hypothetical protein